MSVQCTCIIVYIIGTYMIYHVLLHELLVNTIKNKKPI